jgi:hypothetical protein
VWIFLLANATLLAVTETAGDATTTGAEVAAAGLAKGSTLAGRYRVGESLGGTAPHESFLATEIDHETPVVLLAVSAEQASSLAAAKGVEHAHLGTLIDVILLDDGRHVAVATRVSGQTLAERLAAVGKKPPVDAVRSALRVAEALNTLHAADAVHGFVHARSVIIAPDHGDGPVLTFFPAGDEEPLHAPERAPSAPPTIADDTWAAAGLLHWMLTGSPPPRSGYASEEQIEAAGVNDPQLRAVLLATLATDAAKRETDLRPLRRELARWFVEHVGDEPRPHGARSTHPPPLPHSVRAPPATATAARKKRAERAPSTIKRRLGTIAAAAIALGLIAGAAASFFRPKRIELVQVPTAVAAPSNASPIELGEVPVTGEQEQRLGNKLAACVAEYLPDNAFGKTPDVEWLCGQTDPREGGDQLRVTIVTAAPKGDVTDAMKVFARIGWYQMAAFAVVRAGCCPDAAPLSLPQSQCSMDAALREIGEAVVASKPVDAPLKKYTDSIHCELNQSGAKWLRRASRPEGGEDTAFLELVKRLD